MSREEAIERLKEIIKKSPCWNRSETNVPHFIDRYLDQLSREIIEALDK